MTNETLPPFREDPTEAAARPYVLAVAAVSLALGISLAVDQLAAIRGAYSPYVVFAAAIMLSAVRGGFWAGLIATVLSGLATGFFHLHPLYSLHVENPGELVVLIMFLFEGMILSAVSAALVREQREDHSVLVRYGAGVAVVGGTVLLKLAVVSLLPHEMPFMLFYGCIVFVSWYGGHGPGLMATVLSAVCAAFFFFEPRFTLRIDDPKLAWQLVAFLLEGGLIGLFSRSIERNRHNALSGERAARQYWNELRESQAKLRRHNEVLVELARRPADGSDTERVIHDLTEKTAVTLDVERVSVWTFDPARTQIKCLDLHERTPRRHIAGATLQVADFPSYFRAIDANRSVAASDARTDERTSEFTTAYLVPLGITSMLDAPIRMGGAVAGVVCIEHVGPAREWSAEDEHFAGSIADFVALAFKRQELRAAETKLLRSQRLESLGSLASGIAHDLNNLLTPVLMGTDLLRDSKMPPEQTEILEMIRSSAERGGALIRQILSFARGTTTSAGPIKVGSVVEQVASLMRYSLGKGIKLNVEITEPVSPVIGTATQLDQVLMNLVVNARDAMPSGGKITIFLRNCELGYGSVELPTDRGPGSYVQLSVADTGAGIPPQVLERIFEPFFTTKEPGRGTGLGLATTREIITGLGGFMRVESEVGRGTTFTIHLPAATVGSVLKPDSGETPVGHGELVLVIDDNASIRELASGILEAYGYNVATLADGSEILSQCRGLAPQLRVILLEMTMPAQQLEATLADLAREFPGIPVLLTTEIRTKQDRDAREKDGKPFLPKPYTRPQLLQAIRKVLGPAR